MRGGEIMTNSKLIKLAKEMVNRPSRTDLTINGVGIFKYPEREVFRCEIGFSSEGSNERQGRVIFLDPDSGQDIEQHIGMNWAPKS